MKVPLSWIREFTPVGESADEVRVIMDDLGLVVEGMESIGSGLDGVVVARVTEIANIQGADKIRRVVVDAGGNASVQVVCGAWNFEHGDNVPLANVGSVLPGNFEISPRKMKGVESRGMLCSASELALGGDTTGILILDKDLEPGTPLKTALGIEEDTVFDLAIEGNRPDAMCVAGIARDISARLGIPFAIPELPTPLLGRPGNLSIAPSGDNTIPIELKASDLCDRFAAWEIRGVRIGSSPDWLRRRLELVGMRSINNVVDVSNYVMLELGQPTHPYDIDRLGGRGLSIRVAEPGESIVTLDGVERKLGTSTEGSSPSRDCIICDAAGVPVGIGGIMGGETCEISESTDTILLESAHFDPMSIARTSKRLGLRSEASVRFERGCDPNAIVGAGERICSILASLQAKRDVQSQPQPVMVRPVMDALGCDLDPRMINLRSASVNATLGTDLGVSEIADLLRGIGFESRSIEPDSAIGSTTIDTGDAKGLLDDRTGNNDATGQLELELLEVAIPSYRPDCYREIDVIEEIARQYGYSRVSRTLPSIKQVGGLTPYQRDRRRIRSLIAYCLGADEAWTSSFIAPGDHSKVGLAEPEIALSHPLAAEESILRATMIPGLLKAIAFNASHRNLGVRFFEIGHVYGLDSSSEPAIPTEREILTIVAVPSSHVGLSGLSLAFDAWQSIQEAFKLDGVSFDPNSVPGLHPARAVNLISGGEIVGSLGEIDPQVASAFGLEGNRIGVLQVALGWESSGGISTESGVGILSNAPRRSRGSRLPSVLPSSDFDLAFIVSNDIPAQSVRETLIRTAGDLATSIRLFDVFRGESLPAGTRSLAFRVRLEPDDKTLTDSHIAGVRQACIKAVSTEHLATLRD